MTRICPRHQQSFDNYLAELFARYLARLVSSPELNLVPTLLQSLPTGPVSVRSIHFAALLSFSAKVLPCHSLRSRKY